MRQFAGTKTWYRRAYAAPLAQLISGCVEISAYPCSIPSVLLTVDFLLLREDFQAAICRGCSRA